MPYVSFLVPCFNYARYLRECVDSIRQQDFTDWELVILDDASTDNTPEVAQQLVSEDSRICYVRHEKNVGHLNNYNIGIKQAQGELIWLISADDCLHDAGVLKEFATQFQQNPKLGLAFCRVQCIDENSVPYEKFVPRANYEPLPKQPKLFSGEVFFKILVNENFVASPGAVARKACYEEAGYFHPALTHSGDWYNWLAFSLKRDVYYQPAAKVYYRKHQQNMHETYDKPRHALENSLLCYEELGKYIQQVSAAGSLKDSLKLAKACFKHKHDFPMSFGEKLIRTLGKLTR